MKHFYNILLIIVALASANQWLHARKSGLPFVTNYPPKVYNAHVQNWGATQDANGIMYFANTDGILMYDASSWRLLPVKDNKSVLAVLAKGQRIYSGGTNELGYMEKDSLGNFSYTSLMPMLPEHIRDFISVEFIHAFQGNIIFMGRRKIMQYTGDTLWVTQTPGITGYAFKAHGRYFLSDSQKGLLELTGGQLLEIPHTSALKNKHINFGVRWGADSILLATNEKMYAMHTGNARGGLKQYRGEIARFLKTRKSQCALNLYNDSLFVAGTDLGGIVFFNRKGRVTRKIDDKSGLQKGEVYNLFKDSQDNLWINLSNGIARTPVFNRLSYWNHQIGLDGYVADIYRYNGVLYLGTETGFYQLNKAKLQHIDRGYMTVWDLAEVNLPNRQVPGLLGAADGGLYQLAPGPVAKVWDGNNLLQLHQSTIHPDILYAGLENGLLALRHNGQEWETAGRIRGVDASVRSIYEMADGTLWLGTFRAGAIKIIPGDHLLQPRKVNHYDTSDGLPSTKNVMLYPYNNRLLFATEGGLYSYNADKNRFLPDKQLKGDKKPLGKGVFAFAHTYDRKIWFSPLNTKYQKPTYSQKRHKNAEKTQWKSIPQIPVMLTLALYPEPDGMVWIGGTEGLFRYNTHIPYKGSTNFKTLITRITLNQDSTYRESPTQQGQHTQTVLPYPHNNLRFSFTATSYFREQDNLFSYKLEGYSNKWSAWTSRREVDYTNLFEGDYTFYVRSRSQHGIAGKTASFSFTVKPPWYRTQWAYAGYASGFILLLYLGILLNTYRLKKAKRRLQREVAKRTAHIKSQNAEIMGQKKEIQAQAEQLSYTNKELEKLSIVASKTQNAVAIFNAGFELIWVNPGFSQLYGYTAESLTGQTGNKLEDISRHPDILDIIKKVATHKTSATYETWQKDKNGNTVWVNTTLTPIMQTDDSIEKYITIDSDITRMKEAEQEILQRNEEINAQKEEIKTQRDQVNNKNKEMRASIRAALTIQKAILPTSGQLRHYAENFVIFKPKDIVSGDFYWCSCVPPQHGEPSQRLIAVVDCTGHGVPGAFMSMIGNSLLNEIVNEQKITNPAGILELMDEKLKDALSQRTNSNRDGMNLSIINMQQLDNQKTRIIYAGAMAPIFYYHAATNSLERILGTRRPIGGIDMRNPPSFSNHRIQTHPGDMVYLFSDGIIDQSAPDRKRFGTPRLKNTLLKAAPLSMPRQKAYIEKILSAYQQNSDQRDDITLIGIKL